MFRSSTIIREPALNLAKFIFMLKHCRMPLSHILHGITTHTPFHDMLPHNRIINNDVISPNVLT